MINSKLKYLYLQKNLFHLRAIRKCICMGTPQLILKQVGRQYKTLDRFCFLWYYTCIAETLLTGK